MPATKAARPASFDRTQQARRAMLAKVHIARKELRLDEDDYRQIIADETGKTSAGDCSADELDAVLARFRGRGWQPATKAGRAKRAQHPMAKKARALWISLYQLGEVRDRSEAALEAFAKRQLGCDRLVWARQSDGYRLIEALKKMAARGGWSQTDTDGKNLSVRDLKRGLCEAILAKLVACGEVPAHWTIDIAAHRLCGIDTGSGRFANAEGFDDLAEALGRKLREADPKLRGAS
ncbi:regulatory protein GemA [Citromicrobium bathyomarinum]